MQARGFREEHKCRTKNVMPNAGNARMEQEADPKSRVENGPHHKQRILLR